MDVLRRLPTILLIDPDAIEPDAVVVYVLFFKLLNDLFDTPI